MFLIPRRQIWTQQPQGAVGLSDDVAEYSPVFATVLGSDNRNIVNGQSPSSLVNTKGVGAAGVGLQGDTTAMGGRAAYAVQTRGQQLTIVVTVTPGSYVTSYPMLLETDAASGSYSEGSFFLLPYYRYSGVQPNYWSLVVNPSEGVNTGYAIALIPAPVAGKPHTLVIRMDRALGGFAVIRDVHIDGVKQALSIDDGIPLLEQIPAGSRWNSNNLYINSRSGNSLYGNHLVHATALFAANPPESVVRQWSENPWQIFKRPDSRIFVPVSAGGGSVNANASGALSAVAVTAPSASASGGASSSGALATITIYSPTATASAGGSASASGSFAALSISPSTATATATKSATASGAFAVVSLSAPTATASGTTAGGAVATGAPAQITISHAAAIAIGSAVASGGYQSIGITAPTGSASVGNGNATASGAWAAISITAPAAYASSGFIRAPSGSGPTVIHPGSIRPRQSATSRPINTGGRRY